VLSWQGGVSVTMYDDFCVNALKSALRKHNSPEIFNTDQGSQYTGNAFTGALKESWCTERKRYQDQHEWQKALH